MGYTLSFEASVKVQRGAVAGLLRHNARDVDWEHGQEVRHSNQDIDASRTCDNVTVVTDGQGGWEPCSDIKQIHTAIDARLSAVAKPLRKDAVVLRPLVLQLDPAWYAAHTDDRERAEATDAMFTWAADTFGAQNVVYASLHNDESNPHLHIGICPVTDDGRLSQKDWFSSPAALRKMHQDFREHMRSRGYDIEMQNRKPGKHAKRMEVQEYKDYQDLQREREQLEARERAVEAREACLRDLAIQIAAEAVRDEIRASRAAGRKASEAAAIKRTQDAVLAALEKSDAVAQHQQNSGNTFSL